MNIFTYMWYRFNDWAVQSDFNLRVAIILMWSVFAVFVAALYGLLFVFMVWLWTGTIFYSQHIGS